MGTLGIFKKWHVIRKFGKERPDGTEYHDYLAFLNVQPLQSKEIMTLPEGERRYKRVKVIGSNKYDLRCVDDDLGVPGDWLFYRGKWYRCEFANARDATPAGQTTAQFVEVKDTYDSVVMEAPVESELKEDDGERT